MQSLYINYNGKIINSEEAVITANSRGFRYGDGLFETMRLEDGEVTLHNYHFERLFHGLSVLKFQLPSSFTPLFLYESIQHLCMKNKHANARIRLMVFRGDGGVFDPVNHHPNYIIQTWELPAGKLSLNENGLDIGIYKDAVKSIDILSNLKNNNYLPYIMAALHAKENKWNDSIVLNNEGRICDSSIANIFMLKNEEVFTPSLSEGCVAGVMRRFLLEKLPTIGYKIQEIKIEINDLLTADEIWLTNAVYKLKWVKSFNDKNFGNKVALNIFSKL
jgi:branched-chain amino acid aminotransferase